MVGDGVQNTLSDSVSTVFQKSSCYRTYVLTYFNKFKFNI